MVVVVTVARSRAVTHQDTFFFLHAPSYNIQLHERGVHLLRMIQHHDPPPNYPPYIETQLDYSTLD